MKQQNELTIAAGKNKEMKTKKALEIPNKFFETRCWDI